MDPQTRSHNGIFASSFWVLILRDGGLSRCYIGGRGYQLSNNYVVQDKVGTKPPSNIIRDRSFSEDNFSLESSIISGQSCCKQRVHENPHFPSNEDALAILSRRRKYRLRTKGAFYVF
jgi:hypothetical protein